jgi:hypothetical protein
VGIFRDPSDGTLRVQRVLNFNNSCVGQWTERHRVELRHSDCSEEQCADHTRGKHGQRGYFHDHKSWFLFDSADVRVDFRNCTNSWTLQKCSSHYDAIRSFVQQHVVLAVDANNPMSGSHLVRSVECERCFEGARLQLLRCSIFRSTVFTEVHVVGHGICSVQNSSSNTPTNTRQRQRSDRIHLGKSAHNRHWNEYLI